jgi:hypothetical protein
VVVVPKVKKPVKFSSVSFLGPILDRGVLSVNVKSHERTAQEARYLDLTEAGMLFLSADGNMGATDALPVSEYLSAADEEEFTSMAIARIDTNKIEPGREVD